MKRFSVSFVGRRCNALAARNFHRVILSAKNHDAAVATVHNSYEQCGLFNVRQLTKGSK